ncbi:MAG TPA: hypothetical protein VFS67_12350 [Polyangiaceae bacterium]|nr:hypothetical protein [Polyangiaceae bacterium]
MNKLNDTNSANVKVLDEGDLSQVVGGRGRGGWGGGNHMSGRRGNGGLRNFGGGGGGFGGGGGGGGRNVTFNINITINNF